MQASVASTAKAITTTPSGEPPSLARRQAPSTAKPAHAAVPIDVPATKAKARRR